MYCEASNQNGETHITRVAFGNIDNSSYHSPYSNFTNISTNISPNDRPTLTVNTKYDYWTKNALGAWIDWNDDGIFDNENEKILHIYGSGPFTNQISIPQTAITDVPLRMRIRLSYGDENKITPCGDDSYLGEVEDYTVIINSSENNNKSFKYQNKMNFTIHPNPAKGNHINVTFDSLKQGTYSIVDLLGKTIDTGVYSKNINIQNLESGLYILRIHTKDKVFIKQFIKTK